MFLSINAGPSELASHIVNLFTLIFISFSFKFISEISNTMAGNKSFNMNFESGKVELDLNLSLGNNKGKRPVTESQENKKRKRDVVELEDDSTATSAENKLASLERKIEALEHTIGNLGHSIANLERLNNRRFGELANRVDRHFMFATQNFRDQQSRSIDCMNGVNFSLRQITHVFSPETLSELQRLVTLLRSEAASSSRRGAPSTSQRPPRA